MNAYFDSAVIAKLYVQESNSADAIRLVCAVNALAKREGLSVKP